MNISVCIFSVVNEVVSILHSFAGGHGGRGLATDALSAANKDFKGRCTGHDDGQDSKYKNGMFV